MRLTKIYTKVGDKGSTYLGSGKSIRKSHARIEAYGTIDELNAVVGLLRDTLLESNSASFADSSQCLLKIQHELFDLGGELSIPLSEIDFSKMPQVSRVEIERLEAEIDTANSELPPLENFVLPGGHRGNSVCHLARTVCRRAERAVVRLVDAEPVRDEVIIYLNRLSDWLFVLGRVIAKRLRVQETIWLQKNR